MQLIKLTYLCHGFMLALYGRPLLKQSVEAWRYGPVVPTLYKALKIYGSNAVTDDIPGVPPEQFDKQELDLIQQVFQKYGDLSGVALSRMTHVTGSPWEITWKEDGQNGSIPDDLIADYFKRLSNARGRAA